MKIYKITNLTNNKIYIGQTAQKNPKMRWYGHLADARRGRKSHLYDSIRKYGPESFVWEIIDQCETIEELNDREQHWLDFYRKSTEVYNCREAGGNKIHSAESIEKMREAQKLAHQRRRENGKDGGWKRADGGPMKGKSHPKKGKPSKKWSDAAKEKYKLVAKAREENKRLAKERVL
jgi:group I intron endonuclease